VDCEEGERGNQRDKLMSNVKAPAYPAYRQAGAGRQSSNCFVYRNKVIESFVIKSLNDRMTE